MNPLLTFKLELSQAATLIRQFEALRLKPYRDPVGVWTVGYGHRMEAVDWNTTHTTITRGEADGLLVMDMRISVGHVDRLTKRALTPSQRSALTSFVFNIGGRAFENSTLLTHLNAGEDGLVPREMLRWVWGGGKVLRGLVTRRLVEADLYWRGRLPT